MPRFVDLVDAYLAALGAAGAASRTIETRRHHLAHFVAWAQNHPRISDAAFLTSSILLSYHHYCHHYRNPRTGAPASLLTLRGRLSDLKAWGRWCVHENHVRGDPFSVLRLPKMPRALPGTLYSAEQVAALCAAPDPATPLGLRNRAILETAASVGLTGRELADLTLADLEADTGHLTVRPLERGRARVVPLCPQAGRWVRRYLAGARPALAGHRPAVVALFVSQHGNPMDHSDVAHIARQMAKKAGIPAKRVLPNLKATLAVRLLDGGCDPRFLAALFGHADLQSVRPFQRLSIRRLQDIHRRFHPAEDGFSGGRTGGSL